MGRASARRGRVVAPSGLLTVAVAFGVAVAGCGGSHKATQPPPTQKVAVSHAPQPVSMRGVDGATYETVVIRTDGAGVVGEFIGEWTGGGHVLETAKGHVPRQLAALTDSLSRLIDQYS
jgi:hypothetical protein